MFRLIRRLIGERSEAATSAPNGDAYPSDPHPTDSRHVEPDADGPAPVADTIEDEHLWPEDAFQTSSTPVDDGPLSAADLMLRFDGDPVVMGLPEHFWSRRKVAPEEYTFIRTVTEPYGLNDEVVLRVQKDYARWVPSLRMFVSQENEFPGLRRVVLLGSRWADHTEKESCLITVTDDGLAAAHLVKIPEDDATSLAEILGRLRRGDYPTRPFKHKIMPLNRHSTAWREWLRNARPGFSVPVDAAPERGSAELKLGAVLHSKLEKRARLALHAILTSLDPEILRIMRSTQRTDIVDACWLSGQNVGGEPGPVRKVPGEGWLGQPIEQLNDRGNSLARTQAARAYPVAYGELRDLSDVIDARKPLAPALARKLRISEADVRNLRGVTWQKAGVKPFDAAHALRHLKGLPANLVPRTKAEFRCMRVMQDMADLWNKGSLSSFITGPAKGGNPYRFMEDLKRVSSSDIRDMADYVTEKLILPAYLHAHLSVSRKNAGEGNTRRHSYRPFFEQRGANLFDSFVGSLTLANAIELSDRWHRAVARHDLNIVKYRRDASWGSLVGDLQLGGYTARELTSSDDLIRQGREEGHCVGGYDRNVIRSSHSGVTLIFSLEKHGKVASTVQFSGVRRPATKDRPARYEWSIVQNQGKENRPPAAGALQAGERLAAALGRTPADKVDAYLEKLQVMAHEQDALEALPMHIADAGYNVRDHEQLEGAWNELSVYLPRKVRKAGLDAYIASMERDIEQANSRVVHSNRRWGGLTAEEMAEIDCAACSLFESGAVVDLEGLIDEKKAASTGEEPCFEDEWLF